MRAAAVLVAALCVALCATAVSAGDATEQQFNVWMRQHSRRYASHAEYSSKLTNFRATLQRIKQSTARAEADGASVRYGLNQFSDMSAEEFKAMLTFRAAVDPDTGAAQMPDFQLTDVDAIAAADRIPRSTRSSGSAGGESEADPMAFDWRSHGAVTPVKDQGQCGSCWAFSAVETVESFWFLGPNGTLPTLAPQQVVDCDMHIVDSGCNGGTTQFAFEYIENAGGLDSEEAYPYTSGDDGQRGFCMFDRTQIQAKVKSWAYATPVCADLGCNSQNETRMRDALVAAGPVSVCLNANAWQDYESGIMNGAACGGHGLLDLDHCVQAVGYTRSATNSSDSYWVIRNSWNTSWGVAGYIYLSMGENTCGVANIATQITVAPWN